MLKIGHTNAGQKLKYYNKMRPTEKNFFKIFLMNLKPASFQAALPQDFFSIGGEGMEPQADPLKREFEKQLVRVGSDKSSYPEFSLKGIVPSRFYVYLMVAFFSCFFIMAFTGSLWKLRAPKN